MSNSLDWSTCIRFLTRDVSSPDLIIGTSLTWFWMDSLLAPVKMGLSRDDSFGRKGVFHCDSIFNVQNAQKH